MNNLYEQTYTDAYIDDDCVKIETEHNCGTCGDFGAVYFDKQTEQIICRDCLTHALKEAGYHE